MALTFSKASFPAEIQVVEDDLLVTRQAVQQLQAFYWKSHTTLVVLSLNLSYADVCKDYTRAFFPLGID